MSETPDWDRMVAQYGDPTPVLTSLGQELDQAPPVIDQAHPEPESDPEQADEPSTQDTTVLDSEEADETPGDDIAGDADAS